MSVCIHAGERRLHWASPATAVAAVRVRESAPRESAGLPKEYIFNSLLGLCTITDSDGMFPECPRLWCAKPTQTRALVSVIDYCCLTRTLRLVFPLNLCPLPLLLLPGLGLAVYVRVSVSWHL